MILAGRVSRGEAAWAARIALAEALGADVVTDLKVAAAFPTDHPLHPGAPMLVFADEPSLASIREADVILSLDWVDMVNLFGRVWPDGAVPPKVIQVSADRLVHKAWSRDHMGLPAADVDILAEPCTTVPLLLDAIRGLQSEAQRERAAEHLARAAEGTAVTRAEARRRMRVRKTSRSGTGRVPRCGARPRLSSVIRAPLGWHAVPCRFVIRSTISAMTARAASAPVPGTRWARHSHCAGRTRLPVALVGDGDFLMGVTALWTAVHHRIPVLVIVANNKSYFVDEEHQRTVSRQRKRSLDNAWVGQRIDDPLIDLAAMARAQGCTAERVERRSELTAAIERGIAAVDAGNCHVIDVQILPDYTGLLG